MAPSKFEAEVDGADAQAEEAPAGKDRYAQLPDEVYIPLVDALYADIKSLLVGSVAVALAACVVAFKTGEVVIYGFAVAILGVTAVRVLDMRRYLRIRSTLSTSRQVRHWEDRYTVGATVYGALLGSWTFITFYLTDDPFSWLFSFVVTLAYLVGTPGRNFASNRLVTAQIIGEGVPLSAALFYAGGAYYFVFGLVLLPFFLALKFISDRLRRTLLDAVIANRDLALVADRFDTALNNMPHGLAMFDSEQRLVVINRRFNEIMGLKPDVDRAGQTLREMTRESATTGKILLTEVETVASAYEIRLKSARRDRFVVQQQDGSVLANTLEPMDNGGSVVVVEDITAEREAEAKINRLARFDTLTGLPNRSHMSELMLAAMSGPGRPAAAVMFVDIDGFKQVNDTLGHERGDMLLRDVADRLRGAIRDTDVVARFGGDEFVVLHAPLAEASSAASVAQRIVDAVSGSYDVDGNQVVVGITVGIALAPRDATRIDQLLSRADLALYWAKKDHRGSFSFFLPEMDERAHARRTLELDLRNALAEEVFEVHYQPIVDLESRRMSVCEALVRWPHPTRGMVPPSEFVPVAEEMGLINDLGILVMRRACHACAEWPGDVRVAVNLSVTQFTTGDIVATINDAITEAGLKPNRLEVEITESLLLQETEAVHAKLRAIRNLGVRISLDDFGTGYSNLGYLQSLPLNKVKIDRSFVPESPDDERSAVLLRGMANLGAELGLTVTVEGVETPEQLSFLMNEPSVTEVQGFLFSPAIPAREIQTLLDAGTIRQKMVA